MLHLRALLPRSNGNLTGSQSFNTRVNKIILCHSFTGLYPPVCKPSSSAIHLHIWNWFNRSHHKPFRSNLKGGSYKHIAKSWVSANIWPLLPLVFQENRTCRLKQWMSHIPELNIYISRGSYSPYCRRFRVKLRYVCVLESIFRPE